MPPEGMGGGTVLFCTVLGGIYDGGGLLFVVRGERRGGVSRVDAWRGGGVIG